MPGIRMTWEPAGAESVAPKSRLIQAIRKIARMGSFHGNFQPGSNQL
jgi:hypothetical protein